MATACTADTNSVDLNQDPVTGVLTATVRRYAAGGIAENASGIGLNLASPSGLQVASNALGIDVDGDGLYLTTAGLAKRGNSGISGYNYGSGDDTVVHNAAINRGAVAQVGGGLSVFLQNPGSQPLLVQTVNTWGAHISTTFSDIGNPSNIFDSATFILQGQLDGLGWGELARFELNAFRQSVATVLTRTINISLADNLGHTWQTRLVTIGGTASGTAQQGTLVKSFNRSISYTW